MIKCRDSFLHVFISHLSDDRLIKACKIQASYNIFALRTWSLFVNMSDASTQKDSIWSFSVIIARNQSFSTIVISENASRTSDQQNFDQDIIKLILDNDAAQLTFDSVVQLQKNNKLLSNHAQFLRVTKKELLEKKINSTIENEFLSDDQEREIFKEYFKIRFELLESLIFNSMRWVCKSVNSASSWSCSLNFSMLMLQQIIERDNVNILFVAFKSSNTFDLHSIHAFLNLHQRFEAWMLTTIVKLTIENIFVFERNSFCLHRSKITIQIAKIRYRVNFAIDSISTKLQYIETRNAMLRKARISMLETQIFDIFMNDDNIRECIIYRHDHVWNTFENVFENYDSKSDDLRVAKRIIIHKINKVETIRDEIRALERFDEREDILRLVDWSVDSKSKNLFDSSKYSLDVNLIHEKDLAFHQIDWSHSFMIQNVKLMLCFQLLKRVKAIHANECMHRDITSMNFLLLSTNSLKATLFDFDKFCDDASIIDTHLTDWRFLSSKMLSFALQSNKKTKKFYNQIIDMYMLGLILTIFWWSKFENIRFRIDFNEYKSMIKTLFDERFAFELVNAIVKMLNWDSQTKYIVKRSLNHDCFRTIRQLKTIIKITNAKRLHKD